MAIYERLMEAQERIAQARSRRGVSDATIANAFAVSAPSGSDLEPEDGLYLNILARYVGALGGHLEAGNDDVLAVFPDETLTVVREAGKPSTPDHA